VVKHISIEYTPEELLVVNKALDQFIGNENNLKESIDIADGLKQGILESLLSSQSHIMEEPPYWIYHAKPYFGKNYTCSQCGYWEFYPADYCAGCGSKMGKKVGEIVGL